MPKLLVLVQAGHEAPRQNSGATGAEGEHISERVLVADIADRLANKLNADPLFQAVRVPGVIPRDARDDLYDACLYLHADGSTRASARGFCFGYQGRSSRLADLIAERFLLIRGCPPRGEDNYTENLRRYYGFRHTRTRRQEGEVLVEHGFVTNAADEAWMMSNKNAIAEAEYQALRVYLGADRPAR